MAITLDRLTGTFNQFKPKYEGLKEDYFAPLFISDKFERPIESVLGNCAYGKEASINGGGSCGGGWRWMKRTRSDRNRNGRGAREAQRKDSEGRKRGYQAKRNRVARASERRSERYRGSDGGE